MIYIPISIKTGSGIQRLIVWDSQTHRACIHFFFQNKKCRPIKNINGANRSPVAWQPKSTVASDHSARELADMPIKDRALGVVANCKSWPATLEINTAN
jgi:hypothetical protein